MVAAISATIGVSLSRATVFARALRDDGLLTTGPRGVNAAEMTPLDIARMLIAFLGTDRPVDAHHAVRSFGCILCDASPNQRFEDGIVEALLGREDCTISTESGNEKASATIVRTGSEVISRSYAGAGLDVRKIHTHRRLSATGFALVRRFLI
jgi:hypothetical protein